jgi:hypothetical protein
VVLDISGFARDRNRMPQESAVVHLHIVINVCVGLRTDPFEDIHCPPSDPTTPES